MTSLERARAHLLWTQDRLALVRKLRAHPLSAENNFLAALSWVWECQEQEKEKAAADREKVRERVLCYVATRELGWQSIVLRDE